MESEIQRRDVLTRLWERPKEVEIEESNLKQELLWIETRIRKLKKSGRYLLAARGVAGNVGGAGGATSMFRCERSKYDIAHTTYR